MPIEQTDADKAAAAARKQAVKDQDTPETPSPTQAELDRIARGEAAADDDEADAETARKAKAAGVEHATRAVQTGGENPSMKNR